METQPSCSHYNAFCTITWLTRISLRTWQHQMTTIMQPFHCNLQPQIQKTHGTTHTGTTTRCRTQRRNTFATETTAAAPAAHTRYLSSPPAATLHKKINGFVLRLPPQHKPRATSIQPLQCVLQHHVANPHLSTHMATPNNKIMQPFHSDLQPQIQKTHGTTHTGTTTRCRTQRRNTFATETTAAAPAAHTRYLSSPPAATLHKKINGFVLRLPPQHKPRATSIQPLQCVLQHHVANPHLSTHMAIPNNNNHATIPLRSATTDSKKRMELHTQEQPLVAEHRGGTHRDRNDRSRTRRTHEVPLIAACNHFTRKNTRFRALASSPTQSPCNIHAAITIRFAAFPSFLTTSLRHHFPSSPLPFINTSLRHHCPSSPLPFVTASHRRHFPSSPLPFITTSLRQNFPSSPLPFVTTSLRHHFPSSPLPFITASLCHHFPSSPLSFITTSLHHHCPSSPLPFVTTSLVTASLRHHCPSSPLPFVTTSHRHHFPSSPPCVMASYSHHFPSSPLPFVTTSHRHHFPSSPLPFVTTSLPHRFPSSPACVMASYSFVMYCYVMYHPSSMSVSQFIASQLPLIIGFQWIDVKERLRGINVGFAPTYI